MLKFLKNHWKSITWATVILALCGIPGNQFDNVKIIDIPHFDKIVHTAIYLVFSLLLISENNPQKHQKKITLEAILIAATISISYGVFIEILQKFVFINRSAEFWDVIADTMGFVLSIFLYRLINRIARGYF